MLQKINLPLTKNPPKKANKKIFRINDKFQLAKYLTKKDKNSLFYLKDLSLALNLPLKKGEKIFFQFSLKNLKTFSQNRSFFKDKRLFTLLDEKIEKKDIYILIDFLTKNKIHTTLSLSLFKKIDPSILNKLKKLIFSKDLIYLEPFYSISFYIFQKKSKNKLTISLWEIFEMSEEFLYIGNDKKTSPNEEFYKKGFFIDPISYKQKIQNYTEEIFINNLECAICKRFEFCKGALRFMDNEFDCSVFLDLCEEVEKNFTRYKQVA